MVTPQEGWKLAGLILPAEPFLCLLELLPLWASAASVTLSTEWAVGLDNVTGRQISGF